MSPDAQVPCVDQGCATHTLCLFRKVFGKKAGALSAGDDFTEEDGYSPNQGLELQPNGQAVGAAGAGPPA